MSLDIRKVFNVAPPPLDFIFPGFLAGTVGGLFGAGSGGKSFLTLEAAIGVACSVAGGDILNLKPEHTGKVLYLGLEDPEIIVWHRLYAMSSRLPPASREEVIENLTFEPLHGKKFDLTKDNFQKYMLKACKGVRLAIIDTFSRAHTWDENSNAQMAELLQILEYIAACTGCAILFVASVEFRVGTDHG
ncbi:MAG: AAA family ATPase [Acidithiobacillus sp.]